MYCMKCGVKNDDNAYYCTGCGQSLNTLCNQNRPSEVTNNSSSHSNAVASLVLGLISIFICFVPFVAVPVTIVGLILGIKGQKGSGRGMATAGIVLCIIFLIISVVITLGMIYNAGYYEDSGSAGMF